MSLRYTCPVCSFDQLNEPPFNKNNEPSYEICPCCGFEFGFNGDNNQHTYNEYRKQWVKDGAVWFMPQQRPAGWKLEKQLKKNK